MNPTKCYKCGLEFPSQKAYNAHYKSEHDYNPPVQCVLCGALFISDRYLRVHHVRQHVSFADYQAKPSLREMLCKQLQICLDFRQMVENSVYGNPKYDDVNLNTMRSMLTDYFARRDEIERGRHEIIVRRMEP